MNAKTVKRIRRMVRSWGLPKGAVYRTQTSHHVKVSRLVGTRPDGTPDIVEWHVPVTDPVTLDPNCYRAALKRAKRNYAQGLYTI